MKRGVTFANNRCIFLSKDNSLLKGGNEDNEKFDVKELEVFKVLFY